jgi:hypothetical protein
VASSDNPPRRSALAAAATTVKLGRSRLVAPHESWTEEAWGLYDTLGEFRFAVDWRAAAISRIRLRAARVEPGQDEPKIIDAGPASDLIAELAGNVSGRAEMLATMSTLLDVPGQAFVVGETISGTRTWQIISADELRWQSGVIQIVDAEASLQTGGSQWRNLAQDYYVSRVWRPHKRIRWHADSPTRAALGTMRELELVNRAIQANYLSRLASAGVIIFPEEITFPVREEFLEDLDPFTREWVETAREAIATPGTAAATVPIPMRVPSEFVDKIKHIDFTTAQDEKIIEKRDSAIRRLATHVDIPPEVLTGMGDVNHWSSWQLEESAIKIHILPPVELICHGLTFAFLTPMLKGMGEDPEGWVVWYDASEIAQRPDKSAKATEAYDRLELSPKAYRREIGMDEADAPTTAEVVEMGLKKLAVNPQVGYAALTDILHGTLSGGASAVTGQTSTPEPAPETEGDGLGAPPDTQDAEPPAPDEEVPAGTHVRALLELTDKEVRQHYLRITPTGEWSVFHPNRCGRTPHKCPMTWAARDHPKSQAPGQTGVYHIGMTGQGRLTFSALEVKLIEQVEPGRVK